MLTLEPLIHETFNSPLGNTGDVEGHSVIRTENGGYWYADDVSGDDHVSEAHAEIVRRVNDYPRLVAELENIANAKPSEWGEMRDQFQAWAQNRARYALANACALAQPVAQGTPNTTNDL